MRLSLGHRQDPKPISTSNIDEKRKEKKNMRDALTRATSLFRQVLYSARYESAWGGRGMWSMLVDLGAGLPESDEVCFPGADGACDMLWARFQ